MYEIHFQLKSRFDLYQGYLFLIRIRILSKMIWIRCMLRADATPLSVRRKYHPLFPFRVKGGFRFKKKKKSLTTKLRILNDILCDSWIMIRKKCSVNLSTLPNFINLFRKTIEKFLKAPSLLARMEMIRWGDDTAINLNEKCTEENMIAQ